MTQQEERQTGADAARRASEFVAEGGRRMENLAEDFAGAQSEFWDKLQDSNRKWLDRMQNEASMAADFANRLTSARSLTETASLFQNWTAKHMEMAAEDARRVLVDTQEIFAAGARFWTKGVGDGKGRGH